MPRKVLVLIALCLLPSACAHMPWGHHAKAPYRFFVRHEVPDYAKWRPVYDGDKGSREAAGLSHCRVYKDSDDAKMLIVSCDAADLKKAKDFASSDDLKKNMEKAGVVGAPTIWFGENVDTKCE